MPSYVCDKLTRDERVQICKWSGEGYSHREICKMFNRDRGPLPKIRIPGVEHVLEMPESHKLVSKFRIEFLKTLDDVPVADKKVRLDDLESIRQRLMYLITNSHLARGDHEVARFLSCSNRLLQVLDLARAEMERAAGLSIGFGLNLGGGADLGKFSDEELKQLRVDLLRKAGISVGQRIDPADGTVEGDEGPNKERPAEILLAAPSELRRDAVPQGPVIISDLRRPASDDPGLPAA
jgi:hypothetical protein